MNKRLGTSRFLVISVVATLVIPLITISLSASPAAAATRQLVNRGTTSLRTSVAPGTTEFAMPELRSQLAAEMALNAVKQKGGHGFPKTALPDPVVTSSTITSTNADLLQSFAGLNHRDQRFANGGNQFSLEPPDQGLCVGNGSVLETINTVLRAFSSNNGSPQTGVIDLNTFYRYPAQIDRSTFTFGPVITDPVCYFDTNTQRWFHVVLTLDVVPATGQLTGGNHLDIAVSKSPDPTGDWNLYTIDVTNDGRNGTPSHQNCPCIGDFPHIGADANGIFLTTNEYSLFGSGFNGAQVYAISKRRLAAGPRTLSFVHLDNLKIVGTPAFTMWPAISPAGQYDTRNDGTEYFLSSLAGDGSETGNPTGTDNRIGLWSATNTRQLDRDDPEVQIERTIINTGTYTFPPGANQKVGNVPLRDCLNDTTLPTPFGPGCWQLFFDPPGPAHNEVEGVLDSSDSRFLTVTYAAGLLWGALGTGVNVDGKIKAGIAYYVIRPNADDLASSRLVKQGYIAVKNNNVIYPSIAVTPAGKGVIAMTLAGSDHYPSAAYAHIDASGAGAIHIASAGVGPADGFSEYNAFSPLPSGLARPRWGDYGMAVADGNSIWVASEYINQTCTYAQYTAGVSAKSFGAFGSCSGTRTSLMNWATRISQVTP
jgi:hypothetical protein